MQARDWVKPLQRWIIEVKRDRSFKLICTAHLSSPSIITAMFPLSALLVIKVVLALSHYPRWPGSNSVDVNMAT